MKMNPNIKVINENLWVVNFDLVKAGYIKEIALNNLKPNDFVAILGNGKTVLNQADETAMKYTLPIFKVIMGYPDSLLGTDKGFLIYMRAIDPTLDKYDYQRIVQALKNLGTDAFNSGYNTFDVFESGWAGSGDASFASHNHEYKGTKEFIINNALQTGEKVVLIREQGGQKYLVIDRI